MTTVYYCVHDLNDPAVHRRVAMLQAGGAVVTLFGFRRTESPVTDVEGVKPIDLGRTENGNFVGRIISVVKAARKIGTLAAGTAVPDVILGRNLEMIVIAHHLKSSFKGAHPRFIYEVLDIHRLLLRRDFIGKALRALEKHYTKDVDLLLTSSPAFVDNYFKSLSAIRAPVEIVENKVFDLENKAKATPKPAYESGPITIGWFGALRCKKSLTLLAAFTRKMEGRYQLILRGRPSYDVFPDFDAFVETEPYMTFQGAYQYPDDLASIYAEVDLTWAIDFFEEGQNSLWLLPNRIYEGGCFGSVPIYMEGTQIAAFCEEKGIGLPLSAPDFETLEALLSPLDAPKLAEYCALSASVPEDAWRCGQQECEQFVKGLAADA